VYASANDLQLDENSMIHETGEDDNFGNDTLGGKEKGNLKYTPWQVDDDQV
jgi:hypothetical protein